MAPSRHVITSSIELNATADIRVSVRSADILSTLAPCMRIDAATAWCRAAPRIAETMFGFPPFPPVPPPPVPFSRAARAAETDSGQAAAGRAAWVKRLQELGVAPRAQRRPWAARGGGIEEHNRTVM